MTSQRSEHGSGQDSTHSAMGPGAEFDTIRALIDRWGSLAHDIGDDAALLQSTPGRTVVASTDAFVENAHFRADWISPTEVGARAAAAALSDLAAMGARADAMLVAFTVPDQWRSRLLEVADGIAHTLRRTGGRIVGGNISRGETFSITTTVIGSATRVVRRNGARAGDRLLVTGTLGGPGRAIRAWQDGVQPDAWSRERFASPLPRLVEGQGFAEAGIHAMLDISDGLVVDARHMAAASGVELRIHPSRVPCGPGITIEQALSSGEEYELLIACASDVAGRLLADAMHDGVPLTDIGEVGAVATAASAKRRGFGKEFDGDVDSTNAADVIIVGGGSSPVVEFARGHDHFTS
jgi:thiamine-monophosphate kinase